jgi:4'-phosphopantetheinyl transferase EntD
MVHQFTPHEGSTLCSLFPSAFALICLRDPDSADGLHPLEAAQIPKASKKRVQEFSAGRHCARRALSQLGILNYPLTINEDRTPRWPAGVVGSISHTEGFAAAVVAPDTICLSVGIDVERIGRIEPELWSQICSEKELSWLAELTKADASLAASIIFSAKEAFFKCQYHLTREMLSFNEATVKINRSQDQKGSCWISLNQKIGSRSPQSLGGSWVIDQPYIISGFYIPA